MYSIHTRTKLFKFNNIYSIISTQINQELSSRTKHKGNVCANYTLYSQSRNRKHDQSLVSTCKLWEIVASILIGIANSRSEMAVDSNGKVLYNCRNTGKIITGSFQLNYTTQIIMYFHYGLRMTQDFILWA